MIENERVILEFDKKVVEHSRKFYDQNRLIRRRLNISGFYVKKIFLPKWKTI